MYHIAVFYDGPPTLKDFKKQKINVAIFSYTYKDSFVYIKEKRTKTLLGLIKSVIDVSFSFKESKDGLSCYQAGESFPYLFRCFERCKKHFAINYNT